VLGTTVRFMSFPKTEPPAPFCSELANAFAAHDNVMDSARVKRDLWPPEEMDALLKIERAHGDGMIERVTSRESWREQERTYDPVVRAQLRERRSEVSIVPNDHVLLGFHNQMGRLGTESVSPMLSDIIDEPMFNALRAEGLKDADARHLMYAAKNECERFLTLDPDFVDRRATLERLIPAIRIVAPRELAEELRL
jgi:hypothetical protein